MRASAAAVAQSGAGIRCPRGRVFRQISNRRQAFPISNEDDRFDFISVSSAFCWSRGYAPGHKPVTRSYRSDTRKYDDAVKTFQPYDQTKEANAEARKAGDQLIQEGKTAGAKTKTLIFVNNRLEGNALNTIAAMIAEADDYHVA